MAGIFISAKEVSKICGCSIQSAFQKMGNIKKTIGKKPYKKITINEFCNFEDIPVDEVRQLIRS